MKKIKNLLSLVLVICLIIIACKKEKLSSFDGLDRKIHGSKEVEKNKNTVPIDPNDPLLVQSLEQFAGYDISGTTVPNNDVDAAANLSTLQANSIVKIKSDLPTRRCWIYLAR